MANKLKTYESIADAKIIGSIAVDPDKVMERIFSVRISSRRDLSSWSWRRPGKLIGRLDCRNPQFMDTRSDSELASCKEGIRLLEGREFAHR